MTRKPKAIQKILSLNDTGQSGGHQAGILIPKTGDILSFFPMLDSMQFNPRCSISFRDTAGVIWPFSFIYYNNKKYGGTRNEYRLTGMTRYLNSNNLKAGDRLILKRNDYELYRIEYVREANPLSIADVTLKLGSSWKIIRI